ncbi:hypothetical protein Mal33_39020 [Rosistilla oblonga]|uniref:Uncharacterized protein n=1 Tax=Rosistilla oblonga TaxID=2527990 RepID=A0A518IXT4_9BACT|nr:hypothetical protein Mal33_39020 [Rosistilla oblonga]
MNLPPDSRCRFDSLGGAGCSVQIEWRLQFSAEMKDMNCPQHNHPRFPQHDVFPVIERLQNRITDLETKLSQYESRDGSARYCFLKLEPRLPHVAILVS